MEKELEKVREWAKEKIASGQEPPWAWYQYMKLIDAADAILNGMGCVITRENSQQSEQRQGTHLRLVDATYLPDTAQPRHETGQILLPM